MREIQINLPATQAVQYPIIIGSNLIENITTFFDFSCYTKLFVITDEKVAPLYLEKLLKNLSHEIKSIILPSGESAKDIKYLTKTWKAMIAAELDRNSLIINLGGGVIGDIGGFAASTYMRGLSFINIPTTLLAQVDESVGGKTMIDLDGIKNIVGTFYQPSAVIIDVTTLETLPERQLLSGFAEIIKTGLICDKTYFEKVTNKKPSEFSHDELTEIIERATEIKSEVVQNDEKESGYRKILNYGHTIGHAIEAISLETNKPLLHGEAISIGMIAEAILAHELNLLSMKDVETITEKLQTAELPTELPDYSINQIINKMKTDKKNLEGKINFTLLKRIGEGIINQTAPEEIIRKVLEKWNK